MHKITINHFGPITKCMMDINHLILVTGPQTSGKSTIAKTVFFFKTIKDDLLDMMMKQEIVFGQNANNDWIHALKKSLRSKFLRLFGSTYPMSPDLYLRYDFAGDVYVEVTLTPNRNDGKNYANFEFSDKLEEYLQELNYSLTPEMDLVTKRHRENELRELFDDQFETIFIPAGRSMITLLTSQLNYIFTSMDEAQRDLIDYTTVKYVELILKIKPSLADGLEGLMEKKAQTSSISNQQVLRILLEHIMKIIKGKYYNEDGEERIYIARKKYIKINFASSGQQEAVWILNLLFYYLLEEKKVFLILEEPESHLYPDAQMVMADILGLFSSGNSGLITTHSPYILGEMNNLILSHNIVNNYPIYTERVERVYNRLLWLNYEKISAYHTIDGQVNWAINEMHLIKNELIDGASDSINQKNDDLLDILFEAGEQ